MSVSDVAQYITRYQNNYELWADEILDMKISSDQRLVVDALQSDCMFVSAKSGTGCGKAQPLSAPILTPTGYKPMGTLVTGDLVIGSEGNPIKILGTFPQGEKDIYKVSFSDDSSCEVTLDHLWYTESHLERRRKRGGSVKSTATILNSLTYGRDERKNHTIPLTKAVNFAPQPTPIDPYALGLHLGDGGFIPEAYKYNTPQVRLALLQGLMDTDGTLDYASGKSPYFTTTSSKLRDDVIFLVESLGGTAKTRSKIPTHYEGELNLENTSYNIDIKLPNSMLPFRNTRKAEAFKPCTKYHPTRYITSIELLHKEEAQCIKVDSPDSLYLTDRFILTHNTALAATQAIWFFTTRPEAKVVCTAPTGHQLEDLLFAEMESWIRKIKIPFIKDAIKIIRGKIYIDGYKDWFIVGRTIPKDSSDKLGDVLAGFHAPYLYFIVDEASAVPDQVYSGIEGSMLQKNVFCLLVGNPTRSSGYFYDCFNKNKRSWANVTLSSERSPYNDINYIDRMKEIHGEDSDWFRTKCLGEFPRGGGQVVANYEQIAAAQDRWDTVKPEDFDGILIAGLDPSAGRHDSSILTFRCDAYVYEPERISHEDGPALIPKVIARMKAMGARELYIEYNGLGIILYDLFRRANKPFKVYKVVTNARASNPEAYRNLRAELYKALSDNFDELYLPRHERYIQELPEIAFIEDKEPIQVIDKPKLKIRLKFSPDFSDSLMVSCYRNFNIGVTYSDYHDTMAFELMNNELANESSFAKI